MTPTDLVCRGLMPCTKDLHQEWLDKPRSLDTNECSREATPLEEDGILGEMRDTGEGEGKSVSGGIRGDMGPGTIGPEGSIINSLSPDF